MLDTLEAEDLPIDRDTLDLRMNQLYAEPDASAGPNLQITTVYAAKGLQFDTVILPGLNRSPMGDSSKLLHWFELPGEDQIVMSPMRNSEEKEKKKKSGDLIQFIAGVEKQRKSLEDGRLLYVAATRAVHSLHLFAAIKPTAKGEIKAAASSLLGGLWPAIQDQQTPLIEQAALVLSAAADDVNTDADADADADIDNGPQDDEASTVIKTFPQEYRRLAAGWQLPDAPAALSLPTSDPAEAQDYIEFSWAGEDARLAGNLVHRLLQLIGEQGLQSWEAGGGIAQRGNWCRQQLASDGVRKEKANAIIARASTAITNCLNSKQGRWLLENHQDARCEYAITAVLDGKPKSMVLDRTFVADGTRWIVDYKTSSHGGGDLEGFLANEAERYREQLQRYKKALALSEERPIKTALYFPMLDQLLEV